MEPKAILGVRISPRAKEQLAKVAKAQNRTSSNLVELLINQYLDQVAKRPSSPRQELEFASHDDLHSILSQRRPALVDTLKYLEDK